MSENLSISREVLSKLSEIKKTMESVLGRELTFDQVLVALIDVYTKGQNLEAGRIDMLVEMWEGLQKLERRVSALERLQLPHAEAAVESTPKPLETAPSSSEKQSPQPQKEVKPTPQVVTPKPVQQAVPAVEKQPQDNFLKFLEDVVIYPLDKIRKPREQIDRLIKENIVSVMTVGGQELLVHNQSYQNFLKKLPIPLSDKQKLSPRERKLLETLSEAGLIYEDVTTGKIQSV